MSEQKLLPIGDIPQPSADVELAGSLVSDLNRPGLSAVDQRQQEIELEKLAIEEGFSPEALKVTMGGIYDSARRRHPSTAQFPSIAENQTSDEVNANKPTQNKETIPEGFESWRFIKKGSNLDAKQFDG